jgi:putative ABC transport system permease protein
VAGLILVAAAAYVAASAFDLEIFLSLYNIVLGLGLSAVIGLVSGLIPAWMAARLNPVDAIRMQS